MIALLVTGVVPTTTILVVIAGLVVLGVLDMWRQRVEDWASAALLLLAIAGLGWEGVSVSPWVGGVLSAGVAFCVYLWLGTRGVMGGGDVKLAIVPAFVLGAVSPWFAIWGLLAANAIHQVLIIAIAKTTKSTAGTAGAVPLALPHVPAMAVGTLATVVLFGII